MEQPAAPSAPALTPGPAREEWCAVCKAYTRAVGRLYHLSSGGVALVGAYAFCEICDDPAYQEQEKRCG